MNKNLFGGLCLSFAASIWGGMYVVSKYTLDFIPPLTLVWIRYAVAFITLFGVLKYSERNKKPQKIEKKDWKLLLWIGFVGYFLSISCQFIGTKLSSAHAGALITSATPAFIVIFARVILKEELTTKKLISLGLATLGVVIVIGFEQNEGSYLLGSVVLVMAALTWALLSVYVKIAARKFSSLMITTYAVFFALIFTTPFAVWELQTNELLLENALIVPAILYLGVVSTAGAFFLWNKGMEIMDAGTGSLFFFFQPLVGSFLGWLLLDEKIGINFFLGGILIITSVFIVSFNKKKTKSLKA